jgi:hypothetical protein
MTTAGVALALQQLNQRRCYDVPRLRRLSSQLPRTAVAWGATLGLLIPIGRTIQAYEVLSARQEISHPG